jgi:predicted glycosyltransferase involved in capsule biosynthesis
MSVAIVIPLRAAPGQARDIRRLARLLAAATPALPAVVADDTADEAQRDRIARVVARFPGVRHVRCAETASEPFSIGKLRDRGAAAADGTTVMFHDVDFLAPTEVYRRLADLAPAEAARRGFFCVPVAFLTPFGALAFQLRRNAVWRRLARAAERPPRSLAGRIVLGSSAIVVDRRRLEAVGGHDPAYVGHGAEDFDLMHRLSEAGGGASPPEDYACDYGARHATRGGFRAAFAAHGRPALAQGLLLVHQWHPRRELDARYYAARSQNFERLRRRMESLAGR